VIQLDSLGRRLTEEEQLEDRHAVMREAWRFATEDAADAYRRWAGAPRELRSDAYCAYMAAADREAAAAKLLEAVACGEAG
jgi:hypothetical protein